MARLTRTAKFSDLHDQLNNDKESELQSNDLSQYQNRLNNVQEGLGSQPDFQQLYGSQEVPNYSPFGNVDYNQGPVQPIYGQVQQPQNVEPEQPQIKPIYGQPQQPVYQQPQYVQPEPVYQQPQYVQPEPVYQQPQNEVPSFEQDLNSFFDSFDGFNTPQSNPVNNTINNNVSVSADDFNSYFDQPAKKDTLDMNIDDIYADVFKDVKDNEAQKVIEKERDTYLDQSLNDVNNWKQNNGLNSFDQIIDKNVNEIRHPEIKPIYGQPQQPVYQQPQNQYVQPQQPVYQQPQYVEPEQPQIKPIYGQPQQPIYNEPVLDADEPVSTQTIDDDFSNTVSMEISKIMDEISVNNTAPTIERVEPQVEPQVTPIIEEVAPVLEPEVEEEEDAKDVVEIKNYNEVQEEIARDTISETIPFVVSNDNEEIIEEDDDEEEGSNTVLNVILIVLIIILIAVLGLIVFYILKTKGIL